MSRLLPALSFLPLTTRDVTPREVVLAQAQGETPRVARTFTAVEELLREALTHGGNNDANSAIQDCLRNSSIFKEWCSAMPPLHNVPAISQYRKSSRALTSSQYDDVNTEIRNVAVTLPSEQILFRGMASPSSSDARRIPTSTSLVPSVALSHAIKQDGSFCVLVCKSELPVFVYSAARNQQLAHEFEVLLAGPIVFSAPRVELLGASEVIYLEVRTADA